MLNGERHLTSMAALMAALLLMSGACVHAAEPPVLDTALGEIAWPDEDALTARIVAASRQSVIDRYPPDGPPARRDVHAKAHGCVLAAFRVEPELSGGLARGVFIPGSNYGAWIRFSNGDEDPSRADARGDARGMAIKLTDVPGDKILPAERYATTQDFVLISNPTFFADDPSKYAAFVKRGSSRNPFVRLTAPFALGWQGLKIAKHIVSKRIASPLETRYWSTCRPSSAPGLGVRPSSIRPARALPEPRRSHRTPGPTSSARRWSGRSTLGTRASTSWSSLVLQG